MNTYTQNNEVVVNKSIYFKYARTINTMYIDINSDWTTTYLITFVKNRIGRQDIELVKTGQNTSSSDAEDAGALVGTDMSIVETFGNDWNNNYLAFYIRIL